MAVRDSFFLVQKGQLHTLPTLPADSQPLSRIVATLLPPQISDLHRSFRSWHDAGFALGVISPSRFWLSNDHQLLVCFERGRQPAPATFANRGQELAGWLLYLDKWMETFVVIARARTVWSVAELGSALPFLSPAYRPEALRTLPPDNWERFSSALALALADGTMSGEPSNRHWNRRASAAQNG